MHAAIKLITRADDAGLNAGTNEGVRLAVARGVARNASILAAGPAVEDAAQRLRGLDVCFGFHGCLTSEWASPGWGPLTRDRRLMDERGLFPVSGAALQALNPPADAVLPEMAAQLARLRELGFPVRYMDEHMYFSFSLPALRPALEEFARREGLIYRMEIPCLPVPDSEKGKPASPARFLSSLQLAPPGLWLEINHPAMDWPDMHAVHLDGQSTGVVAAERREQLRQFTDPTVITFLAGDSVRVLRYDELESST
ncbi:MAG: ChbG/HpnK family deacetylase [Opitutaceae bacterium]|jgi:hypothetical protein